VVCLGTDQIQHVEQPPVLIMKGQCQGRRAADTYYRYCWTGADLQ